ncbi:MAG: hypothetical protein KIT14_13090 [bacterium]|nr:hypothetical protein [bacterium]
MPLLLLAALLLASGRPAPADAQTSLQVFCRTPKGAVKVRDLYCRGREREVDMSGFGVVGPQGPEGPAGSTVTISRAALATPTHGQRPVVLDLPAFGKLSVETCSALLGAEGVALSWQNTQNVAQRVYAVRTPPGGGTPSVHQGVAAAADPISTPDLFYNQTGSSPGYWVLRVHPTTGGTAATLTGFHHVTTGIGCTVSVQATLTPQP